MTLSRASLCGRYQKSERLVVFPPQHNRQREVRPLVVPFPRRVFHSFLQEIVDYFEPQLSVSAAALRARAVFHALHVAEAPFS